MLRKFFKQFKIFRSAKTGDEKKARRGIIEAAILKTVIVCNIFATLLIVFGFDVAFFGALLLAFLIFKWNSRHIGALAILALTACPILLSLEYQADAEQMAVYAYYLLVITVVLQIIEFKRHPKLSKEEERHGRGIIDLRRANKNI